MSMCSGSTYFSHCLSARSVLHRPWCATVAVCVTNQHWTEEWRMSTLTAVQIRHSDASMEERLLRLSDSYRGHGKDNF